MMNYVGLGLLFLGIVYTGRQISIYWKLKNELGKLILALSPSKKQKMFLLISGVAFILLLIVVTFNYVNSDIPLNFSYSMMLALVIFSSGRFVESICELREGGVLGKLEKIPYSDIKSYSFAKQGRRHLVKFQLTSKIEFVTLASPNDEKALKEAMLRLKHSKSN